MPDFLARYALEECQAVRSELVELIASNPSQENLAAALAVADEFVTRSISNLSRIYQALIAAGYQFAEPENAFVVHGSPDEASVLNFERRLGKLPLLVSRWYRRIESVDFTQAQKQMSDRSSPLAGLGWHVKIMVYSLARALEEWDEHCKECEEHDRHIAAYGSEPEGPPQPGLITGGCASNNSMRGIVLPSPGFDGVLYNEGFGDVYFGDAIAQEFQYGGFPVLHDPASTPGLVRTLYGEPDREYLTARLPRDLEKV